MIEIIKELKSVCITPEVKLCVVLRNQDRAMATAQHPTACSATSKASNAVIIDCKGLSKNGFKNIHQGSCCRCMSYRILRLARSWIETRLGRR